MYNDFRVAVVIPCYRVESTIGNVIAELPQFVDDIIAVNDASPDSTASILAGITDSRLIVLTHEVNQGVGGAMASGFAKAIEIGSDIVVKVDGDGQMAPDFMASLVDPVAEDVCDYAKGNRFLHSAELEQMPFMRLFGNVLLTFLTKIASGYWHVFDPQNGYVAVRTDVLKLIDLNRLRSRRYFFENEMLIRLNIESARVLDVPMPSIYREEISSLRISRVISYFPYFLVRGFLSRLFHRYVMRDFSVVIPLYGFGFLMFSWGVCFGAFVWWRALHSGVAATTGTVMLSVLPLILGMQMILQALLFEILQTPRAGSSPRFRPRRLPRHDGQKRPNQSP